MKYFTLLHKDKVIHPASSAVVPAEEFSELLNGKELLAKAEEDIALYKKEVEEEAKRLKENAYKEGLKEGAEAWAAKLKEFHDEMEQFKEKVGKMVVPIAIKAAKKVVGKELEAHPELFIEVVQHSLKPLMESKRFTIYVSRSDLELFEAHRESLKKVLENVETLAIRTKEELEPGNAIVETEVGIITINQEELWQALEKAFSALIK
jgi:type III secretion protein L